MDVTKLVLAFLASFITVLVVTPLVIKLAIKIGATDKPDARKVHDNLMPRLGGLAIFIGVAVGFFVAGIHHEKVTAISLGAILIVVLGIFDDIYQLSAKLKFFAQIIIACLIVSTGLTIDFISVPFIVEKFQLGIWAYPLTVFWIVAITNAVNLIDGLDGLAAGVSSIGIATVAIMAGMAGKSLIFALAIILLASTVAFLFYNFHPAKIFMGDTGSLFLGYCLSILSLLGLYKSVTLFSVIIPIIILGVPLFDTTYAIIRRIYNKQPISMPDKSHLHHRFMAVGMSHRKTVLAIYAMGAIFSLAAVILSAATIWVSLFIICGLLLLVHLIAETIGLVNERHRPIMNFYRKVFGKH